jgi:hypothetical protein
LVSASEVVTITAGFSESHDRYSNNLHHRNCD